MGRSSSTDKGSCSDSSEIVSCSSSSDVDDSSTRWPFNMSGEPSDVLVPKGNVPREINYLLSQVSQNEFSFGDVAYLLPILPGLSVNGVGTVSLPLRQEMAEKLMIRAHQEREGAWVVPTDQVTMRNAEWSGGIQSLCTISADRLGFKDVTLQPRLSKLVIYGPGSRSYKQQEARPDCCVATLIVQLPSEYTGGAMVAYHDGGKKQIRYDLSNDNMSSAFRPQYVVCSADSNSEVEQITSGYRLVMHYSLLLPPGTPPTRQTRAAQVLQEQLADAVKKLSEESVGSDHSGVSTVGHTRDGILTMLVSGSCTQEEIEQCGWKALSGVTRDRFEALMAANSILPLDFQLKFYIAQHQPSVLGGHKKIMENVTWYSITGAKIGEGEPSGLMKTLNFLNPDNATLDQFCEIKARNFSNIHERFGIVMWPASNDISNTLSVMGVIAAVPLILANNSISSMTAFRLLNQDMLGYCKFAHAVQMPNRAIQFIPLCQRLVSTIVELGDVTLVKLFIDKFWSLLTEKEKDGSLIWLSTFVRRFEWKNIFLAVFLAIDDPSSHQLPLNRALVLAESFEDISPAHSAIVEFAVTKAHLLCQTYPDTLAVSSRLNLLWKHVVLCKNSSAFLRMGNLVTQMNPKYLGNVVDAVSQHVDASSSLEHQGFLASIAWARRQWLINEVLECQKPFSWQVTNPNIPYAVQIMAFLQGPDPSMLIPNLPNMSQAQFTAALITQNVKASLKITAGRQGQKFFVRIIKTGGEFDYQRRYEVPQRMAEIQRLGQLLMHDENTNQANTLTTTSTSGKKRPRSSNQEAAIIE
ncbi:unnamed protein product [Phytophthora lilii]|uniref:Unnamed protein product n=1 Tax=Phytophthora lilii TaxID=2077276 RepID=A0A9W6TKX9_9STRA|nr:unnamed protein product [Phytophthora lilii]